MSKSAVYILVAPYVHVAMMCHINPVVQTPDPGINFDTTSVLKAPVAKENGNQKPLGWFRTMIECNRERPPEKPQNWPDISQGIFRSSPYQRLTGLDSFKEWGATSLGSLDISVRSIVCSPSNLTADSR